MKVTRRFVSFASYFVVVSCFVLAGCMRIVQPGTGTAEDDAPPLFTDTYLDSRQLSLAARLEAIVGSQDPDVPVANELSPLASVSGGLEAQAVLAGTSGFVYYIQYNPASIIDPYRVYRFDQYNDVRTLVYGGKREVQAVAGSYDGNFFVLSMRQSTTTPNDFEIFRFNILSQAAQRLTDNTVDDTNVSMSGNALSVVWEASVSGIAKIFFRKYTTITATTGFTESILVSTDPQRQPSLSANGKYLALVRDLASGKDQVFRYDLATNVYAGFSSQSLIPLEHPSISNTGKQVAWLQNDVSLDQIIVRNTAVKTIQTVAGPLETLEHPFLTPDGQFITYGKLESATLKVVTKNLNSGAEVIITNPVAPISHKGMMWQMRVFSETKKIPVEVTGWDFFGTPLAIDGDMMVVGAPYDSYDVNGDGTVEQSVGSVYLLRRSSSGWSIFKRLTPSEGGHGVEGDYFGAAVAISKDTLVVGVPFDTHDTNGNGVTECVNTFTDVDCYAGAAYVFQRNQGGNDNWGEVKKLIASDYPSRSSFGRSVAISGDTVIIGAYNENHDANGNNVIDCTSDGFMKGPDCGIGAAYIFQRNQGGINSWGELQKLTASDGEARDSFGSFVATASNTVVVSAIGEDHDLDGNGIIDCDINAFTVGLECNSGAVYVFQNNQGSTPTWVQVKKLTSSGAVRGGAFGSQSALSGDTLIVSAINENSFVGTVYVLERNQGGINNWGEVKKLVSHDGDKFDEFGSAVALDGNTAVVGASRETLGVNDWAGAAYVFERNVGGTNAWGETKKLIASDGRAEDYFGSSVAVSGMTLGVGASADDNARGTDAGAVYIYEW
jgi:hypothetical protein